MEINNFEFVSGLRFVVMNCLDLFNYSITAVGKQYLYANFLIHPWRIIHSTMGRVELEAEVARNWGRTKGAKSGGKSEHSGVFSNPAVR